jgi:hypothetical protein
MVKASTQRPELVQMFEVALSRRICCSRVGGEEANIGAAEVQRIADRLALADDDIGVLSARRHDGTERDDLGEDCDQQRAMGMGLLGDRLEIAQVAEDVRRLDDDAGDAVVDLGEDVLIGRDVGLQGYDLVIGHLGEGLDDRGVMRMQAAGEHRLAALGDAVRHQHGFAGSGRAVIH